MSTIDEKVAQLSEAFYPGTLGGNADEWWRMNKEIGDLRRQRDLLADILLDHCVKTGDVIEGRTVKVHAYEYLSDVVYGKPVWKHRLEVVKE